LKYFRLSVALMTVTLLPACSYIYGEQGLIKETTYEYLHAKTAKDLVIPPGLEHKGKLDFTPLPEVAQNMDAPVGKDLNRQPPVQVLDVLDNTRFDKRAKYPTVFINDKASFIWNTINTFLEENNIKVINRSQDKLVLETDWISLDDGGLWDGIDGEEEPEDLRARYKIQILSGLANNEYRLQVQEVALQEYDDEAEKWINKVEHWKGAAEMLNLLIGNYEVQRNVKILARQQQVLAGFKVKLGQDSDNAPALLTDADAAIVWEKLPRVFKDLGLKQDDKDVQLKTYFVKYEKEEEGFFAKLFGGDEEKLPIEYGDYQVTLSQKGEQIAITWKDGEGNPLSAEVMVKLYPILSKYFGDRR